MQKHLKDLPSLINLFASYDPHFLSTFRLTCRCCHRNAEAVTLDCYGNHWKSRPQASLLAELLFFHDIPTLNVRLCICGQSSSPMFHCISHTSVFSVISCTLKCSTLSLSDRKLEWPTLFWVQYLFHWMKWCVSALVMSFVECFALFNVTNFCSHCFTSLSLLSQNVSILT